MVDKAEFKNEEQLLRAIDDSYRSFDLDPYSVASTCFDAGINHHTDYYFFTHNGRGYLIEDSDYSEIVEERRSIVTMTQEELDDLAESFEYQPWEMPFDTVEDEKLVDHFRNYGDFNIKEFREFIEIVQDNGKWSLPSDLC
jgi:hypothetical protein